MLQEMREGEKEDEEETSPDSGNKGRVLQEIMREEQVKVTTRAEGSGKQMRDTSPTTDRTHTRPVTH